MRLFFALIPEPDLILRIEDWRARQLRLSARPVPPQNLHVTLYFCGENDAEQTRALVSRARRVEAPILSMPLNTFGYFANTGIAWIGPDRTHDGVNNLAKQLATRSERRYTPHLTLFRGVREPPPPPLMSPQFELNCDSFALMSSTRNHKGVRYEPLEIFPLHP
ncbi:RNA 2',3'-cyclic phosphodiesterase [Gammaproteobacteria bacterium]|nr:RNA 2',3'-cyclic phosphodiesterase [Gammaproteobacteria bacterium]